MKRLAHGFGSRRAVALAVWALIAHAALGSAPASAAPSERQRSSASRAAKAKQRSSASRASRAKAKKRWASATLRLVQPCEVLRWPMLPPFQLAEWTY